MRGKRRNLRQWSVGAAATIACVLASGCGTSGPASNALSSSATTKGVSVELKLTSNTVSAGQTLPATVIVLNKSGHDITFGALCPQYALQVALTSRAESTQTGSPLIGCSPGFQIPAGTYKKHVTFQTTYPTQGGSRALTAGTYHADLAEDLTSQIKRPPALTVHVTVANGS